MPQFSDTTPPESPPPRLLLVLGTDASGKNHVTNVIAGTLEAAGHVVEKRDGGLSKPPTTQLTSEDKDPIALFMESFFLALYPLTRYLLPWLLAGLILRDLDRFRPVRRHVIVISHTPLRLLAFHLGHLYHSEDEIRLPGCLHRLLQRILPETGARTIVLDIAPEIRKARVAQRIKAGNVDPFDRYMAADLDRAERIEAFLVWLSHTYLDAVTIENNDLSDAELKAAAFRAFRRFQAAGG